MQIIAFNNNFKWLSKASQSLLLLTILLCTGLNFAEDQEESVETNDEVIEEVVVVGHRASLKSAQNIKENSVLILDAITAEDIGALPDRSVTETLQRVPGVAIDRFAAGTDPDHFSVEGSGVVVRGLSYVRSELNGRDTFTANNGRGLSFADITPELLAGVDVFKTPSAGRIEGGIAGTVNLRTRKPFDSQSNLFAVSIDNNYSDFVQKNTPSASALGSYRWESSLGEFGILGSIAYSELKSRADKFQLSNFSERSLYSSGNVIDTGNGETLIDTVIFPRGAVIGSQNFDRERRGLSAAMQWRSPQDNFEASLEFLRSDAREAWTEHVVEIATDNVANNGDSRAVPGTTLTFTESGFFDSGTLTGPTGYRDDQYFGSDLRVPVNALQSNNIRRDVKQQFITEDFSANLVWYAWDDFAVKFDYQHVDSTVDNLDASLWISTYQDARFNLNGSEIPEVAFVAPQICTDEVAAGTISGLCPEYLPAVNASYSDPFNSFYRAAMDHIEQSEGQSDAFSIDADWQLDREGLNNLRFGYRHAKRDQIARFSVYNFGILSEQWANGGPVWLDDTVAGVVPGNFDQITFDNFLSGQADSPLDNQGRLFYGSNIADNYNAYIDYATAITEEWGDVGINWRPLAERDGVVNGTPFLPSEINPVKERNNALYFSASFEKEMRNGWNLTGNTGIRYTQTDREASGAQVFSDINFLSEEACNLQTDPSSFCALPSTVRDDARNFANGASNEFVARLDYDYWLPTLNLKLDVGEGLLFRAAYFKGVSAPEFGLTRAFYNVPLAVNPEDIEAGDGRPVARFSAGNPYLLPVEADNFDVTAEWYFSEVGQLSLALFYKELKNIVTNDTRREI